MSGGTEQVEVMLWDTEAWRSQTFFCERRGLGGNPLGFPKGKANHLPGNVFFSRGPAVSYRECTRCYKLQVN